MFIQCKYNGDLFTPAFTAFLISPSMSQAAILALLLLVTKNQERGRLFRLQGLRAEQLLLLINFLYFIDLKNLKNC